MNVNVALSVQPALRGAEPFQALSTLKMRFAVFDINTEANAEVAAEYGARPCASEAELLAADVDVVYIATPAFEHYAQIQRAAEAGKHVLCEKPLSLTVEECDRALDICAAKGVQLGTGFMMRFHAQHQAALEYLREGRLGLPILGRAQLSCWYPPIPGAWRQEPEKGGGGSLMDMGGHCIDLLEMFLGRAVSVFCSTGNLVQQYASEDTATVLLEFESGARGMVDCLFNVPDISSLNRLELYGSLGSILAEGTIGQENPAGWLRLTRLRPNMRHNRRDADGGIPLNPYR